MDRGNVSFEMRLFCEVTSGFSLTSEFPCSLLVIVVVFRVALNQVGHCLRIEHGRLTDNKHVSHLGSGTFLHLLLLTAFSSIVKLICKQRSFLYLDFATLFCIKVKAIWLPYNP